MTQTPRNTLQIEPIRPEQTHALRHAVLRPHQRLDEMVYDGDDLGTTTHLGAWMRDQDGERLAGIVTLSIAPMPGDPADGDIRLRGMAVAPEDQGQGVGRLLVEHAMQTVKHAHGRRLWCNARVSAMGFYEKLGFVTHGECFEVAGIGPHRVMSIVLM